MRCNRENSCPSKTHLASATWHHLPMASTTTEDSCLVKPATILPHPPQREGTVQSLRLHPVLTHVSSLMAPLLRSASQWPLLPSGGGGSGRELIKKKSSCGRACLCFCPVTRTVPAKVALGQLLAGAEGPACSLLPLTLGTVASTPNTPKLAPASLLTLAPGLLQQPLLSAFR